MIENFLNIFYNSHFGPNLILSTLLLSYFKDKIYEIKNNPYIYKSDEYYDHITNQVIECGIILVLFLVIITDFLQLNYLIIKILYTIFSLIFGFIFLLFDKLGKNN